MAHFPLPEILSPLGFQGLLSPVLFSTSYVSLEATSCCAWLLGAGFPVSPLAPYSWRRFIHSGGLHYVLKTPRLVPRVQLFLLSSLLPSLRLERLTGSLNV